MWLTMNEGPSAIARAVKAAGSQEKLAESIGVTQGLISQWMSGADIHTKYFPLIEAATGVTAVELLNSELSKHSRRKRRRARVVA
jgi:DNA-binding transcriptional regulator YdaS (Cro superfamily)